MLVQMLHHIVVADVTSLLIPNAYREQLQKNKNLIQY